MLGNFSLCCVSFLGLKSLKLDLVMHCKFCSFCNNNILTLISHIKAHHSFGCKWFNCPQDECFHSCTSIEALRAHARRMHVCTDSPVTSSSIEQENENIVVNTTQSTVTVINKSSPEHLNISVEVSRENLKHMLAKNVVFYLKAKIYN